MLVSPAAQARRGGAAVYQLLHSFRAAAPIAFAIWSWRSPVATGVSSRLLAPLGDALGLAAGTGSGALGSIPGTLSGPAWAYICPGSQQPCRYSPGTRQMRRSEMVCCSGPGLLSWRHQSFQAGRARARVMRTNERQRRF